MFYIFILVQVLSTKYGLFLKEKFHYQSDFRPQKHLMLDNRSIGETPFSQLGADAVFLSKTAWNCAMYKYAVG